jgi:putative PIN family toxin of toxin-antitoxin system
MSALRIVLDTNVLVSGFAYPGSIPGRIVSLWEIGAIELVLSRYIVDELVRVLSRLPRVAITPAKIHELAETVLIRAVIVEPDTELDPNLRDPADQPVPATLRASKADYLITGDKDLLALAADYPILTPAAFWARHG